MQTVPPRPIDTPRLTPALRDAISSQASSLIGIYQAGMFPERKVEECRVLVMPTLPDRRLLSQLGPRTWVVNARELIGMPLLPRIRVTMVAIEIARLRYLGSQQPFSGRRVRGVSALVDQVLKFDSMPLSDDETQIASFLGYLRYLAESSELRRAELHTAFTIGAEEFRELRAPATLPAKLATEADPLSEESVADRAKVFSITALIAPVLGALLGITLVLSL